MFKTASFSCKHFFALATATALLHSAVSGDILYHHRAYHSAIVIGDHLYIDGGELTTWNGTGSGIQDGFGVQNGPSCYNNDTCRGNITVLPFNDTFSIDLSSSWSNQTVRPTTIQKTVPVLDGSGLWLDSTAEVFYSYGGGTTWAMAAFNIPRPPANTLYQFTPTSNGGGWSQAALLAKSNFSTLSRAQYSAYASGNGLGFALGGQETTGTDYALSTDITINIPGLVMYNSSSQQWYNRSTSGYTGNDAPIGSAAHFVPSFGPEGLLFILGGQVESSDGANYASTDSVNIYDPISDEWKLQDVTGDPPTPSSDSCVVGAKGENGTYEVRYLPALVLLTSSHYSQIYSFGGNSGDIDNIMALGDVYVLSIPAFHWQRATEGGQIGRFYHTCNVQGRQMIVVGGVVQIRNDYLENHDNTYVSSVDPWSEGIGVFDLSQLKWRDSYDATLGPYQTPEMVKNANTPRYPDSLLRDQVLRSWFKADESQDNSTTSEPETNKTSHKSDTGAIAGGTVGGIAGLALIGVAIWAVLRHRRRVKQRPSASKMAEELPDSRSPLVERNKGSPQELGGTPLSEKLSQPRFEAP